MAKMKANGKVPKDDEWKKKYKEPKAPDTSGLPELPEGWVWARIEQLTTTVTSGSRGWAQFYAEKGAMFIRAQDIKTDYLVLDNVAHVNAPKSAEGKRTRVNRNDLLITITGANVTKTALVKQSLNEAFVNQHIALARPVQEELGEYLYWLMISPTCGRRKLEIPAYGAGKPGLNLDSIRDLVLPVPPIEEQMQIIQEIESKDSVSVNLELILSITLERVRVLRQAVLHSAFSGNLVPQDPSDQPASVLLGKIVAEREKEQAASKKPTTRKPRSRSKKKNIRNPAQMELPLQK
ncbi:MAG: restriction endonuclease subunit S [Pseudomonadota bacterium]